PAAGRGRRGQRSNRAGARPPAAAAPERGVGAARHGPLGRNPRRSLRGRAAARAAAGAAGAAGSDSYRPRRAGPPRGRGAGRSRRAGLHCPARPGVPYRPALRRHRYGTDAARPRHRAGYAPVRGLRLPAPPQ
nr:hypothetical protein [Tanacetum cinerariifolium]